MLVDYMLVQMKIFIVGWGNKRLHLGQMKTFERKTPRLSQKKFKESNIRQHQLEAEEDGESDGW